MYCVLIQPKKFNNFYHYSDIIEIVVSKCSKKQWFENDYCHHIVCHDTELTLETYKMLLDALENSVVITYNGKLFRSLMHAAEEHFGIEAKHLDEVIPIMEIFSQEHNHGRWAKLESALQHYDLNESVDIHDSVDMVDKTVMLYRAMQNEKDI